MRSPLFFLLAPVLLAACSQAPTAPVSAGAPSIIGKAGSLPPANAGAPASEAGAVTPPSPNSGLSYRPLQPQPARQLADGAQVPAVQGLLASSDRALRSGNFELAAVNLERAQRLAPQSAAVYQRLADVRLRQKRPAEAEQLARKALAYTTQTAQQAALWRQIASARQQLGQTQAALDALQRAQALDAAAARVLP